ncbi:MAG: plasma-membrane proton-efflux P-type ATPase [Firmicutes bacterium]|nr:plasma-membrane proton-efflux P-type ATPase [Alicyclobacillaceae bacterium]MCL6498253.1 plasma-membrane proton-efflux P-type ATPase [Bacillota bacterium]
MSETLQVPPGLDSREVAKRLAQYGFNEVKPPPRHPIRRFLEKFWAPVPWMLEVTVVLTWMLGHLLQACIMLALLAFNGVVSYVQEERAERALELLQRHLKVQARVWRDQRWQVVDARELVPGDVVHVRMGDIVPADLTLADGTALADESSLTGEAVPVQKTAGMTLYSGCAVQRGEATGVVQATGSRTVFGKTAELVKVARTRSHLQRTIFQIVGYLGALDIALVAAMLLAAASHAAWSQVLPFALMVIIASIPVALPATFTLAEALGAEALVRHGVLVTRLSAIEEAASMDVLLSDKTGTITENRLTVREVVPLGPWEPTAVLERAAWASDPATQDPIDLAVLATSPQHSRAAVERFVPFDPATKRSTALVRDEHGSLREVIKGAPAALTEAAECVPAKLEAVLDALAEQGYRTLAVAEGPVGGPYTLMGVIGLEDPPRPDSAPLIQQLAALGVTTKMVTGDTPNTAAAVARAVGIGTRVYPGRPQNGVQADQAVRYDVFAGVYPEDKYHLVRALQAAGHVVGMTGDGVNDAPALKQAEVGIAVANATGVAKAAASMVLTEPGLSNLVAAVDTSRRIYQRMRTYTLNKIIKTLQIALFLTTAYFVTGHLVTSPRLVVLLLFANDFVTMAIATDRVHPGKKPARWRIGQLVAVAAVLAAVMVGEAYAVMAWGLIVLHLPWAALPTLTFLMLVFSGQATVYVVREVRAFWASRPSATLLGASLGDSVAVSVMAHFGWLMVPLPWGVVAGVAGFALLFLLVADGLKRVGLRYAAIE